MSSWQSRTHVVGSRTFQVLEHTTDQVVVNGTMTGTSQQWRTVQDGTSGEIVREFRPPPNTYGLGSYDFDAGHRWLQERYGEKPHGFAPVPHIPKVGEVDANGWTCRELKSDGGDSTPWVETWARRDDFGRQTIVQRRQAGTVLSEERVPEAVAYIQNWSGSGNWTIKSNHIHAHPTNAVATTPSDIVPADAKHFEACTYGGYCDYCEVRIERGSPIWWKARGDLQKSRIWCGKHKTFPSATAAGEEHNTEEDMAQRQDFTFPYLGSEIAASLERKAAKIDARQTNVAKPDLATLKLVYPSYTDGEIAEVIKTKQREVDWANEKLAAESAALRKEAIPYAKASKLTFEIDLEDIEFFGLNDDDAPAPTQKRKRRTKAEMEADAAVSAA